MVQNRQLVIAERALQLGQRTITVSLEAPTKLENDHYRCAFEVKGDDGIQREEVEGVDSMQALYLALEAIRQRLKPLAAKLQWLGASASDTSFPQIVCQGIGPEFAVELESLIEGEMAKKLAELKTRAEA